MALEFGQLRLSDSMLDLCDMELPSPAVSASAVGDHPGARDRSESLASVSSVGSLSSLPRASDSVDSKASLFSAVSLPRVTDSTDDGLVELFSPHAPAVQSARAADERFGTVSAGLPRMSTHGPAIPPLFSADEDALILEEVSNDMHISPPADSSSAGADPWCSGLSPLPSSPAPSARSQGSATVYKMSLARSMTDEIEQFRLQVRQQQQQPPPPPPQQQQSNPLPQLQPPDDRPTVLSTESLKLPGGQWAAFGAARPPALTPAANFEFGPPPPTPTPDIPADGANGFLTPELRAAAARGPPRPDLRPKFEQQLARLRGLQQMLMHARSEFGVADKRYLEVRRRVVACEAGLATLYTTPVDAAENPLSVSRRPPPGSPTGKRTSEPSPAPSVAYAAAFAAGASQAGIAGAGLLGCQPKVKKKRVIPPDPDRKKATPWNDKELADFRKLLQEEGPGDWKGKAAKLGTGRSVKSLHTRWLRDEGRIIDLPRYRNPAKRASTLQKATKGIVAVTSNVAVKLA